jgi:hypothetical protein
MTALALALALTPAAPPGETYTLQWKLKEGDTFYSTDVVRTEQTIESQGQTVKQKMEATTAIRFRVKSAAAKASVVEMVYLDTKFESVGLPTDLKLAEKMKGITFTVTLDDKMKITKFEGYEKFLDALTDRDEAKKKVLRVVMPESMFLRAFGQTFLLGPDKPVVIGDTWNQSENMSLGPIGSLDIKMTRKLDTVKGDAATVVTKGDLTWKGSDAKTDLPFKISKADVKADQFTNTYRFDMKTGRPLDASLELVLSGTMTIEASGKTIEAKLKQKMTMTTTITDQNPVKE